MKFVVAQVINRPVHEVWSKLDSVDNLKKWQPDLKSFEHISGEKGQVGAKSKLVYEDRGKPFEMIETITTRKEIEEFSGTYETKWFTNTLKNFFEDIGGGKTRMRTESDFKCKGLMKIFIHLMKGQTQKRTEERLSRFKDLVEGKL